MKYPYYEVCIGPGPFLPGDDSNSGCVFTVSGSRLRRRQSNFWPRTSKTHGGKVLAVHPISAEEASAFYDLSAEEKWPVLERRLHHDPLP